MSYLATVGEEEASGQTARQYEATRASRGYVANSTRAFSLRPAVFAAWQQLAGAIQAEMDLRRYEVATVAAARQLRSTYCAVAHGEILAAELGEAAVHALVGTDEVDGAVVPDAVDAAITRLATKITRAPADVVAGDYDELRELGLTDAELLDIVLAVAARCFFSTVLEATGTQADAAYRYTVPQSLRDALTVGRPIASS